MIPTLLPRDGVDGFALEMAAWDQFHTMTDRQVATLTALPPDDAFPVEWRIVIVTLRLRGVIRRVGRSHRLTPLGQRTREICIMRSDQNVG